MVKPKELLKAVKAEILNVSNDASFEAFELLKHFAGITSAQIITNDAEINDCDAMAITEAAKKRKTGYPLQYILGEWEFYGNKFIVNDGVLIPRADTETLCEEALLFAQTKKEIIAVDLCSGSGCVAVTLSGAKSIKEVYAIEKSEKAFEVLKQNIKLNNKNIIPLLDDVLCPKCTVSNLGLITANPPYLTKADMESLQKEVTFEPQMALYGGNDGLLFYRGITSVWKERLCNGGMLAFEIGMGQQDDVEEILKQNGFKDVCTKQDLCGIIRVVTGIKA